MGTRRECSQCGHENPSLATYCGNCGLVLSEAHKGAERSTAPAKAQLETSRPYHTSTAQLPILADGSAENLTATGSGVAWTISRAARKIAWIILWVFLGTMALGIVGNIVTMCRGTLPP